MKTIPVTLLAHKAQSSTTLTDLLQIGPLDDGSYRGFTLLDVDVTYDGCVHPITKAAIGSLTFKARTGMEMSALQSAADLGVDNAEANTLPPIAGYEAEGITQEQIDAGALDKVPFVVYRVNYADLSQGHEYIAGGTIGEVRRKVGGMTVLEQRSLSQQLKQSIVELDSKTCRATFGSGAIGSGADVEERFPCGFDVSSLWVSGEVLAVDADEGTRIFTDTGLAQADAYFAPGVVEWLTGGNAGQKQEVESFGSGVVTLQFDTVNPIQLGDTFRIRPDCTKRWTGHNSCETFWGAQKALHFRGEPHIPTGDTANLSTPGVAVRSGGGSNSTSSSTL